VDSQRGEVTAMPDPVPPPAVPPDVQKYLDDFRAWQDGVKAAAARDPATGRRNWPRVIGWVANNSYTIGRDAAIIAGIVVATWNAIVGAHNAGVAVDQSQVNTALIAENHKETKAVLSDHGKKLDKVADKKPAKWGE
jgi:hypothetical protein